MTPLSGAVEYQMRAHCGSGGQLYVKELNAALGSDYKAYVQAYASSQSGGQYYDDKKNKAATLAAQWIGQRPGQMFWNSYVNKKPPQGEVVSNDFWWLPVTMGDYAQYSTPPHTRLGTS